MRPQYFADAGQDRPPLIYGEVPVPQASGSSQPRTIFWHLSSDGALIGPYALSGNPPPRPRLIGEANTISHDPNGRFLFLAGRYDTSSSSRTWREWIYQQEWDRPPSHLDDGDWEAQAQLRSIFWSDLQHGYIVANLDAPWVLLLKGRGHQPIDDSPIDIAADVPRLGVTALLGDTLRFLTPDGRVQNLGAVNSGDDYRGWEEIVETRDPGWLYLKGAQYDNAVHVIEKDGAFSRDKVVRLLDRDSPLDAVMRWIFDDDGERIRRNGLSAIIRTDPCRTFSRAIERLIVCGGSIQELRAGVLAQVGDGRIVLTRFVGDAEARHVALFQDATNTLYAYDGGRLYPVLGALPEHLLVQETSKSRRTFLTSPKSIFELRGEPGKLQLVQVHAPAAETDLFFTRFLDFGGEIVVFLRDGVYRLDGDALAPIHWSMAERDIDITGHMEPTPVAPLDAILFTAGIVGPPRFYLVEACNKN